MMNKLKRKKKKGFHTKEFFEQIDYHVFPNIRQFSIYGWTFLVIIMTVERIEDILKLVYLTRSNSIEFEQTKKKANDLCCTNYK